VTVPTRTAPLRLGAVAVLALALVLTACSSDPQPKARAAVDTPTPSATTSTPPPPPQPSRLSGRMGKTDGPVYAVKVDNTHNAHPQQGLQKADVVYVEQVEGGVTRLAAIYSSDYPTTVGPVRSGRITDIELLRQYGTVGLIYSGSQNRLAGPLRRADLKLVSFDQDRTGYTRSPSRPQPYDVIGTFARLRQRAGKVSKPPEMGYTFGPAPAGGKPAKSLSVRYPMARVGAVWSAAQKRWLVSMDGSPDRAAEGGQLGPTTFVVQFVTVKPSIYHDVNGVNTPQTLTVGKGRALFFRDGQVFEGAWSRAKASRVTSYTIGGQPASFAPGQLWITLIGRDRPVTVG
jgi:Protein of unknown function (DUF3048) N-terminal domain/Protein of unknown function (DUF3048) C-terminal domain